MESFKTRARTLDMLGRQQIAGIPTAISELFKNAHDAYADHVEIDYYRRTELFVLRDDGSGMTKEEFVSRWLTIGTESKVVESGLEPSPARSGQRHRRMLGEKGIGRLAIATIGPQVLILTRSKRDEKVSDLTAAFVNWTLFECPGIDLEDIKVPIWDFPGGELPSRTDVEMMVEEFSHNNKKLRKRIGEDVYKRIVSELEQFDVNPEEIDSKLGKPSLREEGRGTHFIIQPVSELLPLDIEDDDTGNEKASPLTKALLGFTNTMTPGHAPPVINTAFRDHREDKTVEDLISDREFFTPEQFENADHQISGHFDEFGQFMGEVSIYGEPIDNHVISWPDAGGMSTECGPFSISFAAIEGKERYSTLPAQDHALMAKRMNRHGGLYIYRDGIRILPYGDTDYDWLDIELNRTKSAYYYYFSHRKMFGVVEIDSEKNKRLHEKAGREGFRENRAYRQFKSILKNFFLQVAADFFRKEGAYSDRFEDRKAEMDKIEKARQKRKKHVSKRRMEFTSKLAKFSEQVSSNNPHIEVSHLTENVSKKLKRACSITDPKIAAREILKVEREAESELLEIEDQYKISKPRIGLSKSLQKEWDDYIFTYNELSSSVFRHARGKIESMIKEEADKARVEIDRRLRVEASLQESTARARKLTKEGGTSARTEAERVGKEVREYARACLSEVENELRSIISDFERTDISDLSDEGFWEIRSEMEGRIQKTAETRSNFLEALVEQLRAINPGEESSMLDQLVAVEQKNVSLEEEIETDLQLAQLGMAVEVINHEFISNVNSLRKNLRRLNIWAQANPKLQEINDNIRISFDHLDGYLNLFTPLHRRLRRKSVDINGENIFKFLRELFQERFERHSVVFIRTDEFSQSTVHGHTSSFYPVFVNLVDNSVYWLSQQNSSDPRQIVLDAADGCFSISDTGPGVSPKDREDIFEFGFSRKPQGRGMGLHISREVLGRAGYSLTLSDTNDEGATFLICPLEDD